MSTVIEQLETVKAQAQKVYGYTWVEMIRAQREFAVALRAFMVAKIAHEQAQRRSGSVPCGSMSSCVITEDGQCIGGSLIGESCPHDRDRRPG